MIRVIDETGNTYGYLTVETEAGRDLQGRAMWRCKCKCGRYTVVRGANLRLCNTKSCGCLIREKRKPIGGRDITARVMRMNGLSVPRISTLLGVCTATVYRYLKNSDRVYLEDEDEGTG